MTDVHGELLKCVLQLAACSDKLRTTDAMLGKFVGRMQQALPASGMPQLTSKLAVVPANPDSEKLTLEDKFQEVYDQGTEATERLEITKSRLEKELRRRSESFRDLVKSRNTDIQEEYARMLKELDDQTESLDQEIAQERELKAERAKRRQEEALQRKASKKQRLEVENTQMKVQLDDFSSEIRQLQEVFATLEKDDENQENEGGMEDEQTPEERRRLEEERAQNEIVELEQEIVLLKEAQDAMKKKIDKQSLKAQYEEENQEVLEEVAHLKSLVGDVTPQITSDGVRLHSLLRSLAPSPGIGTLMTRLYQQLSNDSPPTSSSDMPPTPRKTVDLKAFLNSCPSFEEGNRAIDELKKLQLVHCYESSGIIALAD
ncbi:hypothetical protein PR003_g848 [Phytophthora rubi]|uniref:Uncharacterized protein n=1 Tax=Phytophthora rubi TaxID=129364 RepID=A0A6A3PD23_9STRA|nr:hypothetical protein PR002_g650 [Phytophthora rubi]KAE9052260.1 hypothetical protein PR001_g677 [Phytophthora rubi]KAE9359257.1 hypothetical protein PR003_g848 [Phytophthora rubi]